MAEFAVVILNYNGRSLLDDCLASLARLTLPAEIVVADNGSTDRSIEHVRQNHPAVRVIDLGRNLGFAAGYNRALAEVDSQWVVLLNNDAALAPDWIEQLCSLTSREPRAAILGGKLLFGMPGAASGPERLLQSAGASFTDAGTAFEVGWGECDCGQYDQARRVGAIPGAAMLVKRSVFLDLGGFEPDYYAYLEDVDLCWRAWLRGYEVHYWPAAVAFHRYGASGGGRASPFRIRWMQRNRLANMTKNLELATLPGALAVSLAYDAYRVLEYTRARQPEALRALATGTWAFWRDLPTVLARRQQVQRARQVSDGDLRAHGLMVPATAAYREYRRLGRLAAASPGASRRV